MNAVLKVLFRASSDTASPNLPTSDVEVLKMIAILSGVGLAVSLILASYGLDLSPGFF
jgi:hypothetical protein